MNTGLLNESAIQITFFLFAAVIIVGLLIAVLKLNNAISRTLKRRELSRINKRIASMTPEDIEKVKKRKEELEFQLKGSELSGDLYPSDPRGLVDRVGEASVMRFIPVKRSAAKTPFVQPRARRLILWYIVCATFWLLFGTTVGEYVGFKFVLPDLDHLDWLSFGRLRPVHTNAVFWGWSSIAMVGFA
ncbi:MAG: cytochrome oxidase subunit I, partial [Chryseobacterium sp.]